MDLFEQWTDYRDVVSVKAAFLLHKETMKETYSIQGIAGKLEELLREEKENSNGEQEGEKANAEVYDDYEHEWIKQRDLRELDGKTVDAMVYIMNSNGVRPPDHFYYGIIRQGYEMNGLDISFLEQARLESLTGR